MITAEAKEDWRKGTLILGKSKNKMVLLLFSTLYQGETQDEGTEFIIDGYETESEDTPIESIHNVGKHQISYNAIGIGEYLIPMKDDYSNNVILSWQKSCSVHNITTVVELQPRNKQSSSSNPYKRFAPLKKTRE